jgi:hypothetical protein
MKINTFVFASALLSTLVAVPGAMAGTNSSRRAEGSLGSARASADSSQYLACTVKSTADSIYMGCAARDASGLYRACSSYSPDLIQAALSISASSMIVFTWDANYACQTLDVANGSLYLPTTP